MIELPAEHYQRLSNRLDVVNFNHLFACAVLDRTVSGRIYVDSVNDPRTFYVVHRYGMSLLCGDFTNTKFNSAFRSFALNSQRTRSEFQWMQVFPAQWNSVLEELLTDKLIKAESNTNGLSRSVVEVSTRVNFVFESELYFKSKRKDNDPRLRIVDSTKQIYDTMQGAVVPRAFWNSSKDFIERGVSFTLYCEGKIAATAFSSFVAPGKLELGIETLPEFRGRGLAERVCSALIDYCLERKLEPIWACRQENTGSFMLAKNLGFVPTLRLPYYRLSN